MLRHRIDRGACVSLLAGAVALSGCKPRGNTFVPPPPAEVTVAHAILKPVTLYLEYTGTTEAYESVDLRARVPGFLDKVNFKPGAAVRKDDLLFQIDPRVYDAAVRQAQADLDTRRAALTLAELTLVRVSEAAKSVAVSAHELDKAIADRDQAKAQVELAEATLANAKLNVEFTQIRAPMDGRITKSFADPGNLVGSGGQATVLATIVNTHPVFVTVDVSESDVLMVRKSRMAHDPKAEPGQANAGEWRVADMATSDSNEFNIHGRIDYVDPALNPQSGTIRVRCRFENEDDVLLPGLFVRMRVHLDTSDSVMVPEMAISSDQSGRYVLVVNEKDVVEVRHVKTGVLDGTLRVIQEGLTTADRVVVNGLQRARPGATVKPTLKEFGEPARPANTPNPAPK